MVTDISHFSDELTREHIAAATRARVVMGRDDSWDRWFRQAGLEPGAAYLEVDDREKPYRMVRGSQLTYKVGAARIVEAEAAGRLVAEWLAIFGEMFDYWAEKKETDPPPPLPAADTELPPEVEANLVGARADEILTEAEMDEWERLLDEEA